MLMMTQDHRLQAQRFELKYLVDHAITSQIRDFVGGYLDLDEYGVGKPDLAYPVHSLYLDSDDLATFQAGLNGSKNRFKLRLRYYDDRPHTPVFFEIKARVDNCIRKQRCGVRRQAVPLLLSGHLPEPDHLLSHEPRHLVSLQRFHLLAQELQATPKTHVCYLREAWVSRHDNSIRVTFDRQIRVATQFSPCLSTTAGRHTRVFSDCVILELKFTGRFPNWFQDLVQCFNLMRFSASKYVEGILSLGEFRLHDGDRVAEPATAGHAPELDPARATGHGQESEAA
jgi:hypothetical protein